ncbi:hypothetical protein [Aurantivibrio infirmus]
MKKILILLFIVNVDFSWADKGEVERPLWYDREYTEMFGTDSKGIAIYQKGFSGDVIEVDYEYRGDGYYSFGKSDIFPFRSAFVDEEDFSITLQKHNGETINLPKGPNVQAEDIVGKWYSYSTNGHMESSGITIMRESDLDSDYVWLDHKAKTYFLSNEFDFKVPYKIHNGWHYYEGDLEELTGVITFFSEDRWEFISYFDQTKHIQVRYSGQKNLTIPKEYKLEE